MPSQTAKQDGVRNKPASKMVANAMDYVVRRVENIMTLGLSEGEISSIVEAGGGRYVGIQNENPKEMESHALFSSPQTKTTLVLPISRLTAEAVREQLAESNAAFTQVASD